MSSHYVFQHLNGIGWEVVLFSSFNTLHAPETDCSVEEGKLSGYVRMITSGRSQEGTLLSKNFLQAVRPVQLQAQDQGEPMVPTFYFSPLALFTSMVLLGIRLCWHQKKVK